MNFHRHRVVSEGKPLHELLVIRWGEKFPLIVYFELFSETLGASRFSETMIAAPRTVNQFQESLNILNTQ